jgi:hypothetical protein
MKKYYGNYLGICINNQDPEYRGRVQIFIPHIMPTLYESWNKDGEDITIECVGNNLSTGLKSDIIDKLIQILPWSEAALPVVGTSTAGSYNSITGNFNQTSGPEDLVLNEDISGASGVDLIFRSERQLDANGNLKVYSLPSNDGGGAFEIAGINVRWHRDEANNLKNLIEQGQYQQAEQRAKNYIASYTNPVTRLSIKNPGIEYALRDIYFNRGPGGANWMAKQAAGVPPNKAMNEDARKQILNTQKNDPVGFLNRLRAAAEQYEATQTGSGLRPNLIKGLRRRWNDRLKFSLSLAVKGGGSEVTDPAVAPDAAALPPTPHPFNNSEAISQSWNDPSLASVTQVDLDRPTSLTLTGDSSTPPPGSITPTPGGFSQFNWTTAVTRSGLIPDSKGVARLPPKGTTACMRITWNIAGYIAGVKGMAGSSNIEYGKLWNKLQGRLQTVAPNFWGLLGEMPPNYQPQQGDIASHDYRGRQGDYGHAQIYVDGNWRSHVAVDQSYSFYAQKSASQGRRSRVFRLTAIGQDAVRRTGVCNTQFLGQPYSGPIIGGGSPVDETNGSESSTALVQNPTGTMTSPLDTTGLPQGLFAHPAPGALLWVFFREGSPLHPVYFAASYGASEWQAMQQASSPPLYDAQNGGSEINSESHFRPNNAGTLMFRGNVTTEKDNRAIRLAHASGGYFELLPTGSVHYSPNESVTHVAGNGYNYCLNREEWTQGDENRVTIGNQRIVVGNPSQANIEAIEELTQKVKSINQKMLEQSK